MNTIKDLQNYLIEIGYDKNKIKSYQNAKENFYITFNKKDVRHLNVYLEYDGQIKAPIDKDQKVAELKVFSKEELIKTLPLYASEKVSKVNFLKSLFTSLNYLIWGDV